MSNKIGFWSVFELVTIGQIGSGLMLPATLAPFGTLSLLGWGISSLGALVLAVMFSKLCVWFPRTGGPHVYVKEAFGAGPAFFTGWTYWVISWVSTIAIIISAVGYLTPFIGEPSSLTTLALEILILTVITIVNLRGVYAATNTKSFTIVIKLIPFLIVPLIALCFFDKSNFTPVAITSSHVSGNLNSVILLTLWGFIGFESATATVGEIKNPSRTIPYAMLLGTFVVSIIYFISSLGIMGVISGDVLMNSQAPYSDTIQTIFGGQWHLIISFIAAIVCIGAVNAWTLASGQIAVGITNDRLMPRFFAIQNKHGAPIAALLITFVGTLSLLVMTHNESLVQKVHLIIDFSVTSFLFVYIITCLAFLRLLWKKTDHVPFLYWVCGILSLMFCAWVISATPLKTIFFSAFFVLSGLPIYLLRRNKLKDPVENILQAA